jgi:hypothetical protein
MSAPTPTRVDELAQEYLALKGIADAAWQAANAASLPAQQKADELKKLVEASGSAHAEKSKILHGIGFEIMATFGQSVSIDAAAVEMFRLALVKAKQARLLKRVFEKTVRWSMARNAATVIKAEKKLPAKLLALYSQCEVVKSNSPSLKVRAKEKTA